MSANCSFVRSCIPQLVRLGLDAAFQPHGARRGLGRTDKPGRELRPRDLGTPGSTVRAAWPTTRPALSLHQLGAGSLDPSRPRLRLLAGLNPTYPFIAGERCKVFPGVTRLGVRKECITQIRRYLVHHAGRDLSSGHDPLTTRSAVQGRMRRLAWPEDALAAWIWGALGSATACKSACQLECGVRLESASRRERMLVTRPNMSFVTPAAPSPLCIPSPSAA